MQKQKCFPKNGHHFERHVPNMEIVLVIEKIHYCQPVEYTQSMVRLPPQHYSCDEIKPIHKTAHRRLGTNACKSSNNSKYKVVTRHRGYTRSLQCQLHTSRMKLLQQLSYNNKWYPGSLARSSLRGCVKGFKAF